MKKILSIIVLSSSITILGCSNKNENPIICGDNTELKDNVCVVIDDIDKIKQDVKDLEISLESKNIEIKNLNAKLSNLRLELKNEMDIALGKISNLRSENDELYSKYVELNSEHYILEKIYNTLVISYDKLYSSNSITNEVLVQTITELKELKAGNNALVEYTLKQITSLNY